MRHNRMRKEQNKNVSQAEVRNARCVSVGVEDADNRVAEAYSTPESQREATADHSVYS